ncbi:MAG: hypothetical protein ACOH1P_01710 [Lysobacter sp.]
MNLQAATILPPGSQSPAARATGTAWEPLWLGHHPRRLYGALHPAAASQLGLIVVAPLLHEQQRTRRLVTELAATLAAKGFPCLRFDFFGSGDSEGDGEQLDYASMRSDLQQAAEALRASTGVTRVGVLAMRGAALPVWSWLEEGAPVELLVMWEPLLAGPAWLAQLEEQDRAERCSANRYPLARGACAVDVDHQLMGFPVSPELRRDLAHAPAPSLDKRFAGPCWGVLRADAGALPVAIDRVFQLPHDTPFIGGSASMDMTMFMGPGLQRVVSELAAALGGEG